MKISFHIIKLEHLKLVACNIWY